EEPIPTEHASAEEVVEVEDAEEEEGIQDMVEEEEARPQKEAPKDADATENASPIRKPRKQMELDPKMVEIFKKVE
ncbi:hypothetical protein HN51_050908, partial [Arachis hypogaea]